MITKEVKITNAIGLHARPATFFIQKANMYNSSIWVEKDDRKVNAKSLLGAMATVEWSELYCVASEPIYTSIQKFCIS